MQLGLLKNFLLSSFENEKKLIALKICVVFFYRFIFLWEDGLDCNLDAQNRQGKRKLERMTHFSPGVW